MNKHLSAFGLIFTIAHTFANQHQNSMSAGLLNKLIHPVHYGLSDRPNAGKFTLNNSTDIQANNFNFTRLYITFSTDNCVNSADNGNFIGSVTINLPQSYGLDAASVYSLANNTELQVTAINCIQIMALGTDSQNTPANSNFATYHVTCSTANNQCIGTESNTLMLTPSGT